MKPVALEVAILTEHKGGIASLALNNVVTEGLTVKEQNRLLDSLFKLTRNQLINDLKNAPEEKTIDISPDENHEKYVLQMKLLMTETGEFSMVTYFGGLASPTTSLKAGLQHALQVVAILQEQA